MADTLKDRGVKEILNKIEYETAQIELAKKYEFNVFEHETQLAIARVLLAGLTYWNTISDDEGYIVISKYFKVCFDTLRGVRFSLTEQISGDMYKYVCDSWSELYRIVNERLAAFLGPTVNEGSLWGQGRSFYLSHVCGYVEWLGKQDRYDIETHHFEKRIVDDLKMTVTKLTSDAIKSYLELAEKYIDMLIEKGKAKYEE